MCLCTHWTTYINPGFGPVSVAAHEGALLSKCGTSFKPQRDSPAAWRGNQIPHPEVTHSLTQPQSLTPPSPPSLPPLGCTHPCRCRASVPRRCRSCTPGLCGGHRVALRGSPGWAARRTPCSSRSRPAQSWLLGGRSGASLDTHTPLGSLQSPGTQNINIILKSASCKRTREDNSDSCYTDHRNSSVCVVWTSAEYPALSPSLHGYLWPHVAFRLAFARRAGMKGTFSGPQKHPPPCSCSLCFPPPITPHTPEPLHQLPAGTEIWWSTLKPGLGSPDCWGGKGWMSYSSLGIIKHHQG